MDSAIGINDDDNLQHEELWSAALERLEGKYSNAIFEMWLKPIRVVGLGPYEIVLSVHSNFARDWRPRSEAVEHMAGWFAAAYQSRLGDSEDKDPDWADHVRRMESRWGIFHDPHELWEVEFAWFCDDFLRRPQGNHAFWRTTPIGTISYIDRYDLPIEEHYARARAIVAAGSEFEIVGDVEAGELRIFRMSGVERHIKDVRIPEWPWFAVPVKSGWEE